MHDLVAKDPQLLPLSGSPRLIVIGREVLLGSGYADLLAVEPDGRPVIIETKLRNNTESRRAVVAQVLACAAALHGISAEQFEREVLARHLGGRGLLDVVRESAQEESPDASEFAETLGITLRDGTFRLVLVLVDEGLAEVSTYFGKRGEAILLPRLLPERAGLVSLWRWTDDSALLSVWRSVFERRAPKSIERVELLIAPTPLGKGNTVSEVSDDLLTALYGAYVEANSTRA